MAKASRKTPKKTAKKTPKKRPAPKKKAVKKKGLYYRDAGTGRFSMHSDRTILFGHQISNRVITDIKSVIDRENFRWIVKFETPAKSYITRFINQRIRTGTLDTEWEAYKQGYFAAKGYYEKAVKREGVNLYIPKPPVKPKKETPDKE